MKTHMLPVVVGALSLAGCFRVLPAAPEPLSSAVLVRQESLVDAAGDAAIQGDNPPDLMSSELKITAAGTLYFEARFAAGTFSRTNTVTNIYVDLDRNTATGYSAVAAGDPTAVSGWEYRIQCPEFPNSYKAAIQRATSATTIQTLDNFTGWSIGVSGDTLSLSGPAKLLQLDGQNYPTAYVRVVALHRMPFQSLAASDYMPDLGAATSRAQ